jgi:hypothetical protein
MMLIPLVNIVVGIIIGAGLGGALGAIAGLTLAISITAAQKLIGDRCGWFELACAADDAASLAQGVAVAAPRERMQLTRKRPLKLHKRRQQRRPTVPFGENTSHWLH